MLQGIFNNTLNYYKNQIPKTSGKAPADLRGKYSNLPRNIPVKTNAISHIGSFHGNKSHYGLK